MSNKPPEGFKPFRGRRGINRRKSLLTFLKSILGVDADGILMSWESLFLKIERSEGTLKAVKRTKDFYSFALRWSCGLQTDPIPFTKSDKSGFPRAIWEFKKYLKRSPDHRRAALTVLQCFKLVDVKGKYSLESITRSYGGLEHPEWVKKFEELVMKEFPPSKLANRISRLKPGYHISGSNGPNGPSLGTAFVDREVIRGTNIETSCLKLARLTGFKYLYDLLNQTKVQEEVSHRKGRVPTHSRIRIKYESGGKARPFAIYDFFSQSALKSIHDYSMNWLADTKGDSSRNHSRAAEAVREWTKDKSSKIWSYDLTSATDRFPVFLQRIVMKHMLGDEIAEAWEDIMINRTFTGPEGEEVRFSCGQPLGALSSWPVFTIAHHFLLQTAASESLALNQWYTNYRMIGDDISILGSERVALTYKSYLDDLNVDISIDKSVLPEQCLDGTAGEIAKRLFHQGIEVTPVPPDQILVAFETPVGVKNLLESAWGRGYLMVGSPYPVQSLPLTRGGWAGLTFPIRNVLPQLNGVKQLFPSWEATGEAPAGLAPGWFSWVDSPEELLQKACRRFLFGRVNKAVSESQRIQQQVLLARYSKSERESLPQGGDWKPGTLVCHPEIVTEVFSELQEELMKNQSKLWDDNLLIGEVTDLYVFIGSLHKYLEPKILLTGRSKFKDEKEKTLCFVSALVKYCSAMYVSNDWSILDSEPEVESFPLADEFDFALIDLE